jgi:hypothetical protein
MIATTIMKKGTNLYLTGKDILGNAYGPNLLDDIPAVPAATKTALSDVTDTAFWRPYNSLTERLNSY